MIAGSQTIAEDRAWFYLLRSSAITIAELSAIWDPRSSAIIWKPAFRFTWNISKIRNIVDSLLIRKKKRDKNCNSFLCANVPSKRKQRNVNECALFISFAVGNDWPIFSEPWRFPTSTVQCVNQLKIVLPA